MYEFLPNPCIVTNVPAHDVLTSKLHFPYLASHARKRSMLRLRRPAPAPHRTLLQSLISRLVKYVSEYK
jgi:hypothetical protein